MDQQPKTESFNDLDYFVQRNPVNSMGQYPSLEELNNSFGQIQMFQTNEQFSTQRAPVIKMSGQMYKYKNFIARFSKRYFLLEGQQLIYSKKKELTEMSMGQSSPVSKFLEMQNEQILNKSLLKRSNTKWTKDETKFFKQMNRINLQGCKVFPDKNEKRRFVVISTDKKQIRFKTESSQERDSWVTAISQAIKGEEKKGEMEFTLQKIDDNGMEEQARENFYAQLEFEKGSPATLEQISQILTSKSSHLNATLDKSQSYFEKMRAEMEVICNLNDGKKIKEQAKQMKNEMCKFREDLEEVFDMLKKTQKQLFDIAEDMAIKQMKNKDRNTLIRESFRLQKGELLPLSLDKAIPIIEEEEKGQDIEFFHQVEDDKDIDEIFYDAVDFIPSKSIRGKEMITTGLDPLERELLPYLKDPKQKISIWTILKDAIGKDITKMSLPVYFCDPLSIVQKTCQQIEYIDILEKATTFKGEENSLKRLAYVAVFSISMITNLERTNTKPFNSLLGETFELVSDKYQFLAEQVSHHPPITAFYVRGKAGFRFWSNSSAKSKFTMKSLEFVNPYRNYMVLEGHGPNQQDELYEVVLPNLSAHNLIIGTPYVDLGGLLTIKNVNREGEIGEVQFFRRGWSKNNAFRVQGEVKSKNGTVAYKIQGNWNSKINVIDQKGNKEVVFDKYPYHELQENMYGYSHFTIQLNNFLPSHQKILPPTDTRRRPDQRALENGEMKTAASEKNRLEEKQRVVRRKREKAGLGQVPPLYFEEKLNERDGLIYYLYNHTYFEKDRLNQDWQRCPDIFGETVENDEI